MESRQTTHTAKRTTDMSTSKPSKTARVSHAEDELWSRGAPVLSCCVAFKPGVTVITTGGAFPRKAENVFKNRAMTSNISLTWQSHFLHMHALFVSCVVVSSSVSRTASFQIYVENTTMKCAECSFIWPCYYISVITTHTIRSISIWTVTVFAVLPQIWKWCSQCRLKYLRVAVGTEAK